MSTPQVQNPPVEDDEVPTLEAAEVPQVAKQTKRYAKAMAKMGLKPEPNVVKVHIRKHGSLSFLVNQPELYRFPGTNTFLVFGEAQLGDTAMEAQEAAARAVSGVVPETESRVEEVPTTAETPETPVPAEKTDDADAEDAGELDEREIKVVMSQGNTDRAGAIRALKNNKGDIVNAILELTM
ncbi:nascent polypeptide associated complex subunit [Trypanosoma cruzi Dm28c]|uniref:Nascent polypeptide associated complex subunit n=1 Tax=Trypanosoma cruzi Dm28c TaxID=1416333 RepID=V5BDN6_TRYCR|nr:nascent polypeptide associated complex subunit [Trypanosoma cruzi Dm28c]KAF8284032.1 putative nascent polypeptide associated complex subunit [Trypanosoma cruzi]PBJ69376.1 nascent polypeptide associated complex subunit [Trypanosoma cruzi cruzi]